jgi:hypothetical protein
VKKPIAIAFFYGFISPVGLLVIPAAIVGIFLNPRAGQGGMLALVTLAVGLPILALVAARRQQEKLARPTVKTWLAFLLAFAVGVAAVGAVGGYAVWRFGDAVAAQLPA